MLAGALPELVNEFLDVLEISKYCNRLSAVQNIHHNIKVSSFYNNKLKLNMANNELTSSAKLSAQSQSQHLSKSSIGLFFLIFYNTVESTNIN